jgi:tetratricopeptide (TPR) repeat protein
MMLARSPAESIRWARQGLELAEQLGLDDLRATLLNTIGTCRTDDGDAGGFADLERALAIATEIVNPGEMHRAYNNLAEARRNFGDWNEASRLLRELREADERFGLRESLRWVEGEEVIQAYHTGDWDRAVESADAVIAEAEAGSPNYLEAISRLHRAQVRLARNDDTGALDDTAKAVDLARRSDPQVLGSVLAARALVLLTLGDREEASRLASETLEVPAYFYTAFDLATVLHDLDRAEELRGWLEVLGTRYAAEAARAIGRGDFHRAAEILAPTGNVADEAYARLRSGRDEDVRRALEFYGSVGATRYIAEAEALLAASA